MNHRALKSIISISAEGTHHWRFQKQSLAGALYIEALKIRQGGAAAIASAFSKNGTPLHIDKLQMAAKRIHAVTRMRLRIENDPDPDIMARLYRLKNAPKSDATSDT
jgi:hypothetical protein